jgi:predicted O-methyltransferase YrrM
VNSKLPTLKHLAKKSVVRLQKTFGIEAHHPTEDTVSLAEKLSSSLDPQIRSRLLSMYRGEPQFGADGNRHSIDQATKISPSQGMWLHDLCVSTQAKATLEIGMAFGYSTLYFLAAIARNGSGHHTSIDPFQNSSWRGIGLAHAQAVSAEKGWASAFRLIEDRSDRASADLARSHSTFDVIFIDGGHRFDDVLVDFYLYAPLCATGGHMIFDDIWMHSIQTVVAYIRANRPDFIEVPTGERNICVFRKVSEDERDWTYFRKFTSAADSE